MLQWYKRGAAYHHYSFNFDSPYFEGKIIVAISVGYSASCKL